MTGVDPAWLAALLALAGLAAGWLAGAWGGRRALHRQRDRLEEGLATGERQRLRAELEAESLRERLGEQRAALSAREAELVALRRELAGAQQRLAALNERYNEKLAAHEELKRSLDGAHQVLRTEFRNLANEILDEKGRTFSQASQASLEGLLRPFREQIQGFQQRINQVHDESLKGQVSLGAEIRRVLEVGLQMSSEANTLASALKGDKKVLGNWGEMQLEQALQGAGLARGEHYQPQARFQDAEGLARQPDFVVRLPDGKHIVIDSKVSLVDYGRAVEAATPAEAEAAIQAHIKAVKNHIDDLSRKDYSNLSGMRSPSFVLMFMPIEPAYIEALRHGRELFHYGYQRNVVMVSHTTLMPILKTVANLWMVARSNEQAHELAVRAGEVYNQVAVVAENLKRLGDTLGAASGHYNRTVTALAGRQGLYGKAERFNALSSRANKALPPLSALDRDLDTARLDPIAAQDPPGDEAAGRGHP